MNNTNLRKTKLFDLHAEANAKLTPFGDWCMPISFEGIIAEHQTVREKVGIFDVSHMGEILIRGKEALECLQYLTINDVSKLQEGMGQYTAMLNNDGGIVDDLILYCIKSNEYLLCVNASNTEKDYQWVKEHSQSYDVEVANESDSWSQIAIQGPKSSEALCLAFPDQLKDKLEALKYMDIIPFDVSGEKAYIARTGYTGEHGYEIYLPNQIACQVWKSLLDTADKTGLKPIGLGARDTLRLEACYLLYGNDMDDSVSPLEAGIGWATKINAKDFIGKDIVAKQKEVGLPRKTVGFKLVDKGIARHGMKVYHGEKEIGTITSGSHLPTVDFSGGLVRLDSKYAKIDENIEIDIRGKRKLAKIVKRPLYSARVK